MNQIPFLLIFGLLWLLMGVLPLSSLSEDRKRCTKEAQGTIIDFEERRRREYNNGVVISKFPVVCFKSESGIDYVFTSRISSSVGTNGPVLFDFSKITHVKNYEEGTIVKVCYDPNDPTNAFIKSPRMSFIIPLCIVILGILQMVY